MDANCNAHCLMSSYETNADQLHAVNLLDTCNGYSIPVELLFASFFLTFQSSSAHYFNHRMKNSWASGSGVH